MEMIMEYHILFIIMAFILFLIIMTLLFIINPTKGRIAAAMIFIAFNITLCFVNALGFFGIGFVGYGATGEAVYSAYHELYPLFAIYFVLVWVNTALMFYAYYLVTQEPWLTAVLKEKGSEDIKF